MSSFFSNVAGEAGSATKAFAGGLGTTTIVKGIALLAVVAIVIIVLVKISSSLNVGLGSLFGGGNSADANSIKEISESEERIKELDVELKEQLQDDHERATEVLLDATRGQTEEVKRSIEREAAQTETVVNKKVNDVKNEIINNTRKQNIIDKRKPRFEELSRIWDDLFNGRRVNSLDLQKINQALKTGTITIDAQDVLTFEIGEINKSKFVFDPRRKF